MYNCKKAKIAPLIVLLVSAVLLSSFAGVQFIGRVSAAGSSSGITLTPNVQTPNAVVTVSGTGFGAANAVGIGFGAEVAGNSTNMAVSGTGTGPYTGRIPVWPIKPGTVVLTSDASPSGGAIITYIDNGDGTLSGVGNPVTINYATGQWSRISPIDLTGITTIYSATYTRYQYNVTPTASLTANAAGSFSADITVPNVSNGNYVVTAIDSKGNIATSNLNVGAGTITLSPLSAMPNTLVSVSGVGFGSAKAVGIGFGVEVNVINETWTVTGPFDVGTGPYTSSVSHVPMKPGTFRQSKNITSSIWSVDADLGNGTLNSTTPVFVNATINYVTGQWTLYTSTPVSSSTHYMNVVNYTYYQYNVTSAAGVTTNPSGTFTASITVPNVPNGVYTVTVVDTQGHIATATLTVGNAIPESLPIGVMLMVSFLAVTVSARYFRKRPKFKS